VAIFAVLFIYLTGQQVGAEPEHTFVGEGRQPQTLAERYCTNVANKAANVLLVKQMQELQELSDQVAKRSAALEQKLAELKDWVRRRDDFVSRGTDTLVNIFAAMRPDSASAQLIAVDERTAAAILMKLKPRTASSILNEMDPERAARLAATIAGAARVGKGGKT